MTTRTILIILNLAGLLASLIWLMTSRGWEALVVTIGLVAALIAQLYKNSRRNGGGNMTQKGGSGSKNYQSKGDINIRNDKG